MQGRVELLGLRQRIRNQDPARERERVGGLHRRGDLLRGGDRVVDSVAAVGQPERREAVGPEHEHGDAQRLQPLERGADVENRLDAGRDDRDPAAAEDPEVGGFVERGAGVAVHAADPARGEHADPAREASNAVAATVVPPVVPCAIATGRSLALSFNASSVPPGAGAIVLEAHVSDPVQHRDRRGHRATLGDRPLELERGPNVLGSR